MPIQESDWQKQVIILKLMLQQITRSLGPLPSLLYQILETFQLFPENNYSASLNYRQLVYDFGRTRQNIELENENKVIGEQTIEQVKQKLSLFTVNNFYTLVFTSGGH